MQKPWAIKRHVCWPFVWALLAASLPGLAAAGPDDSSALVQLPPVVPSGQPPRPVEPNPPVPGPDALPMPRPADAFGPDGLRMPLLPGVPGGLGQTPQPTPEVLKEFGQFVERTVDPKNVFDVVLGRPRILVFKQVPIRIQIAADDKDPVASVQPVSELKPKDAREWYVVGKRLGSTVLNIWFTDPDDPTKERILSYLVRVLPDPVLLSQLNERLDNLCKALTGEINRTFPDSVVCVTHVGEQLVLSGQAKDITEGFQILRIVYSHAPQRRDDTNRAALAGLGDGTLTLSSTDTNLTGLRTETLNLNLANFRSAAGPAIVNLLRIPGEQQVALKVTVAEVDRTSARSIGVNFDIKNKAGTTVFANLTGGLFGNGQGGTTNIANLPAILDNGQIVAAINALKTLNYARTLAEPTLVAINGESASFQAGGEFPVPVVTGFTASGLQGVSFVPFGVQLNFRPIITDKDRIRLEVAADVSTKDVASSATVAGTNVPGLNTRQFRSIVELREGQTLAVAGLIQNNLSADTRRVPFFGDLPIVGRLLANDDTSAGEQELVILITPELIHPLEPNECPPLPGSNIFEPSDIEFYLLGRVESRRPEDNRSTVRNELARQARYHHCDDLYIIGPQGYSEPPAEAGPVSKVTGSGSHGLGWKTGR